MKTTRRGFFGLLAGAVAAKFLPAPVKKWTVYPPIPVDLPPAHIPMVGDIIFEGLQYNALGVASVGSYAGISRAPLPPNARFNKSMRLIDDYFKRRQHGQQRQD
jgi:hypothetical protein